jgi:RimJ/RimL family protein N-acetyltransferase
MGKIKTGAGECGCKITVNSFLYWIKILPKTTKHKKRQKVIRKATQNDFDFIYHLHIHPQVNRFLFHEISSAEEFKPIFNELLDQDILYVYEADDALVGMFKLTPKQHRCAHISVLGGVAVQPPFSGKGHAQRMLQEIIMLGKEKGVLRLELGVSTINKKAIHIYEKAGFEKEGFFKKYIYLKNENLFLDDVLMAYFY